MSGKLSSTVLRRGEGSNPFSLVEYTSKAFKKKLEDAGMARSISRISRCIDNGPMEAFWGMLKSEMYYLRKFNSYNELETTVIDYIDYYNNHRYQKRLNCMTPKEYRQFLLNQAA
jgi:transposase InsO family protein